MVYTSVCIGDVAQLGERLVRNQQVEGSTPFVSIRLAWPQGHASRMSLSTEERMINYFCPYCGDAMASPESMVGEEEICEGCQGAVIVPNPATRFNCPRCGSDSTQRVSLIYESGTFNKSSTGAGVALAGDDFVPILTGGSGTSQSHLAARLAPPMPKASGLGIMIVIAFAFGIVFLGVGAHVESSFMKFSLLGLASIGFVGPIVAGVRSKIKADRHNNTTYREQWRKWNAAWLCQRCGFTFIPK